MGASGRDVCATPNIAGRAPVPAVCTPTDVCADVRAPVCFEPSAGSIIALQVDGARRKRLRQLPERPKAQPVSTGKRFTRSGIYGAAPLIEQHDAERGSHRIQRLYNCAAGRSWLVRILCDHADRRAVRNRGNPVPGLAYRLRQTARRPDERPGRAPVVDVKRAAIGARLHSDTSFRAHAGSNICCGRNFRDGSQRVPRLRRAQLCGTAQTRRARGSILWLRHFDQPRSAIGGEDRFGHLPCGHIALTIWQR